MPAAVAVRGIAALTMEAWGVALPVEPGQIAAHIIRARKAVPARNRAAVRSAQLTIFLFLVLSQVHPVDLDLVEMLILATMAAAAAAAGMAAAVQGQAAAVADHLSPLPVQPHHILQML